MAQTSQACYHKSDNQIFAVWSPCSNTDTGVTQCCNAGDTCGSDGFCHIEHPDDRPISLYYTSGCTDPTYNDVNCNKHCTDLETSDVVYDSKAELWACCYGSGELDCRVPSNQTFQAPPPQELFATTSSATSATSMSSTSSSTSTTSSSAIASTTSASVSASATSSSQGDSPNNSSNNKLGAGAIAGIAIGVVIVVAAVISLLFVCWRRRQRRNKGIGGGGPESDRLTWKGTAEKRDNTGIVGTEAQAGNAAMDVNREGTRMQEMRTDREHVELPGEGQVERRYMINA